MIGKFVRAMMRSMRDTVKPYDRIYYVSLADNWDFNIEKARSDTGILDRLLEIALQNTGSNTVTDEISEIAVYEIRYRLDNLLDDLIDMPAEMNPSEGDWLIFSKDQEE